MSIAEAPKEHTPEEKLQIRYSKAAYKAGDLEYKKKCIGSELDAAYAEMSSVNQEMAKLLEDKKSETEAVQH